MQIGDTSGAAEVLGEIDMNDVPHVPEEIGNIDES